MTDNRKETLVGKKSEKGNVIELIIIGVLVLAVVGLIAWRFLGNNNKSGDSPNTTETSQTANKTSDSTSTSTSQQTDQNKGYIVISDWGVRFKNVNGVAVNYYKAPNTSNRELYEFSTPTIEALTGCSGKNSSGRINGYLGGVERTTERYDLENMASAPSALYGGNKIGNYYYYYYHPQAFCSMSDSDAKIEAAQAESVQNFLSTLEPVQ